MTKNRRSIRLKGFDYSQEGLYFVTICVQKRMCFLGEIIDGEMELSNSGMVVKETWRQLPNRYLGISLGEVVLMPNHMHGIIAIKGIDDVGARSPRPIISGRGNPAPTTLGRIIAYFKYQTTKLINTLNNTQGLKLWQRNYWDHVIRDESDYLKICQYIQDNPGKWLSDELYVQ